VGDAGAARPLALPGDDATAFDFASVVVEAESMTSSAGLAGCTGAIVEIVVGDVVIRAPETAGAAHLAQAIRAASLAAS